MIFKKYSSFEIFFFITLYLESVQLVFRYFHWFIILCLSFGQARYVYLFGSDEH